MSKKKTSQPVDNTGEIKLSDISILDKASTTNLKKRFRLNSRSVSSPARRYLEEMNKKLDDKTVNMIKSLSFEDLLWLKYENCSEITKSLLYLDEDKLAELAGLSAKRAFWSIYENMAPNDFAITLWERKAHFSKEDAKIRREKNKILRNFYRRDDKILKFYKDYNLMFRDHQISRDKFFANAKKTLTQDKLDKLTGEGFKVFNLVKFQEESEEYLKDVLTKGHEHVLLEKHRYLAKKKRLKNGITEQTV